MTKKHEKCLIHVLAVDFSREKAYYVISSDNIIFLRERRKIYERKKEYGG